MPSQTITISSVANGQSDSQSVTNTADGGVTRSVALLASTDDQQIELTIDVTQLQSIYMNSTVSATVETNSGGAPTDTIALVANEPYVWWTGSPLTNLITADITADLFVSVGGAVAGTFTLDAIIDSTIA